MADPARAVPPEIAPRRDLLKQRQEEAQKSPSAPLAPEEIPATVARVQRLQALKTRAGQALHPRTASLKKKGRVLVSEPKGKIPKLPRGGLATIADFATLGGKLRGRRTWKTAKQRREGLSKIGRKGGLAKARKRREMVKALEKLDRQIERDKRKLLKAGVPISVLE